MTKDNSTVATLKIWIFPSMVSLLSLMIWNDVNEIKADVKALIAQSNIDKTRIDNLERAVFGNKSGTSTNLPTGEKFPESPYNAIAIVHSREELVKIKQKKKII
jgi:hypothetical protein